MKIFQHIVFVVISFSMFFSGCAALGSSSQIYDRQSLMALRKVYVAPVSTNFLETIETSKSKNVSLSPTFELLRQLRIFNIFVVYPPDTNFIIQKEKTKYAIDEKEAAQFANAIGSDAFVYTNLTYTYFVYYYSKMIDAKISVKIIDTRTQKVLAECSHDTNLGNSYMFPQPIDTMTVDVIKGAMLALQKTIKESK